MIEFFLHKLNGLRFSTKITLGVALMMVACGLSIGAILSAMSSRALMEEGKKRGMALTTGLAFRLAEPILAMDFLQIKKFIDNVQDQYDDLIYIFVSDTSGNVLSHTFSGGFPVDLLAVNTDGGMNQPLLLATESGAVYDFNASVVLGEKPLGAVRLGMSRRDLDAQIRQQRIISLLCTLGVVSLGILLALWFARTVTKRLNRLRASAEEIVKGNLDIHVGSTLGKNCWEIMTCDRRDCPAYGDVRRRCWYLAGTLCANCQGLDLPAKMVNCRQCSVFMHNFGDEIQDLAEAFDVMAVAIKNHIEEVVEREHTIIRQQSLLKTILNVTPDLVTLQDRNLHYTFAGKAFCDMLGRPEDEVVGRTDRELFPPQQAEDNMAEDQAILASGQPLVKEIVLAQGEVQRWFHVIKVPVYDQDGSIMSLLLTARDISMLKKFQEQLIQAQKMEDLGRLAGGVAHEINTPLGIILGYAQLLMDDITDPPLREQLEIIEKQTKICRKIVADLLGFSRHAQSAKERVDINDSLREVIMLVEHVFSLSHIRIMPVLADGLPQLTGNKERLKQVWLNLCNNAADAIGQDGEIHIRSTATDDGRGVVISVADTGQGVKPEHLGMLFDPFFTTKPVGKGTGLGLSVSFGIIKEHGGTFAVQSPPPAQYLPDDFQRPAQFGPGTVFIVTLPGESSEAEAPQA